MNFQIWNEKEIRCLIRIIILWIAHFRSLPCQQFLTKNSTKWSLTSSSLKQPWPLRCTRAGSKTREGGQIQKNSTTFVLELSSWQYLFQYIQTPKGCTICRNLFDSPNPKLQSLFVGYQWERLKLGYLNEKEDFYFSDKFPSSSNPSSSFNFYAARISPITRNFPLIWQLKSCWKLMGSPIGDWPPFSWFTQKKQGCSSGVGCGWSLDIEKGSW